MTKIDSFYEFIKQKSLEKGRPLKIISDWDDTMQTYASWVNYEVAKKTIKDNPTFEYSFENWSKEQDNIREQDDIYDQVPFTVAAEELLRAVKENFVKELVFLTHYNRRRFPGGDKRKQKKIEDTFGSLSEAKTVIHLDTASNPKPKWIKENQPDFDIFIDDNPSIISESIKTFSPDKTLVIINQELLYGRVSKLIEADNVFHLTSKISSIKDTNFRRIERNLLELQEGGSKNYPLLVWSIGVAVFLVLELVVIAYLLIRNRKTSKIILK